MQTSKIIRELQNGCKKFQDCLRGLIALDMTIKIKAIVCRILRVGIRNRVWLEITFYGTHTSMQKKEL